MNDGGDIVTAAHVFDDVNAIVSVLANAHLSPGIAAVFLLPNGEKGKGYYRWNYEDFSIRPAGVEDKLHDIAVFSLSVPEQFKNIGHSFGLSSAVPVTFDTEQPRDGEAVYAGGFPMGAEELNTTSGAVITAWDLEVLLEANRSGLNRETQVYRLGVIANPGNSGGPVFASKDQHVLGMIVEVGQPGNAGGWVAVAVPAFYITQVLRDHNIPLKTASTGNK